MKHISINVSEEIKNILPDTLEKDLQDHEELCPVCHGLGVAIDNNIFGIKGDTSEAAKKSMFPYNHQAIKFCPNCFNGVIRLCQYCGKQIRKGSIDSCDCEQYKAKEEKEIIASCHGTFYKVPRYTRHPIQFYKEIKKRFQKRRKLILKILTRICGYMMNRLMIISRMLIIL